MRTIISGNKKWEYLKETDGFNIHTINADKKTIREESTW